MSAAYNDHPLTSKHKITESIQYQLIPIPQSTQYFEESSSMISLSNYLQQDDSSLCLNQKSKPKKTDQQIEKQRIFNEIQCAQKIFMKHLGTDFDEEQNSLESESMLLTFSSIKENKLSVLDNSQYVAEKQTNTNFETQRKIIDQESQNLPSRINPLNFQRSDVIRTDSVELLELLAIPKEPSTTKNKSIPSENQNCSLTEQMLKLQQVYEIFQSNKDFFKKANILKRRNLNDSKNGTCVDCENLLKKIQNLQSKLESKQKEIKKYENLIEKLNSTIFDLKIENKQLFFENKQYTTQIEKLLQQKNDASIIQRFKTVNYDYEDNSLDEILKESSGVTRSYTNLSRKTTKICEQNYNRNIENQQIDQIDNQKIYPLTPMPSSSHLKSKNRGKSSNHSDKKLEISISQVRQPSIYELKDVKSSIVLKEHNRSPRILSDKKSKCVQKSQKNVKRFSDISREVNDQYVQYEKMQSGKKISHQPITHKSPTKTHGFLKVKTQNIQQNLENLKKHPLNKICQEEDNNSQTSETKTQKFYGFRKFSNEENVHSSNDYNMLSANKVIHNQQNVHKHHDPKITKTNENGSTNSIVYKSFKQIGGFYQNDHPKYEAKSKKRQNNVDSSKIEYEMQSYNNEQVETQRKLRNREKSQRKFPSPSLKFLNSEDHNYGRIFQNRKPQTKPSSAPLQIKSFLR